MPGFAASAWLAAGPAAKRGRRITFPGHTFNCDAAMPRL